MENIKEKALKKIFNLTISTSCIGLIMETGASWFLREYQVPS